MNKHILSLGIRYLWLIMLANTLILLPVYVQAYVKDKLPEQVTEALSPLGHGKLTFFGLHVYDATLYTEPTGFSAQQLGNARYALALRYARGLDGSKIAERTDAEIAKQAQATDNERKVWLAQMKSLFPDVKKGDVLVGLHTPNKGTSFYLNGKAIGDIEGTRFAQQFFGIWLAETTSEPALRRSLLTPSPHTKP